MKTAISAWAEEQMRRPCITHCEIQHHLQGNATSEDAASFFARVSPKIEYLFWLSQNINDDDVFAQLVDFLSHYQTLRGTFDANQLDVAGETNPLALISNYIGGDEEDESAMR